MTTDVTFSRTGSKYRVKRDKIVQPDDPTIKLIPLTKSKISTVDASEYERVNAINWHAFWNHSTGTFYARAPYGNPLYGQFMHRFILGMDDPKMDCDHVNGDTCDNRRENLRVATRPQNAANGKIRKNNKSGYPGVNWREKDKIWVGTIRVNGVGMYLGCSKDKEKIIQLRKEAEEKHFGEFSLANRHRITTTPH
jgi:hypothetical protein